MRYKKDRTPAEKINECLDKCVQNLHPTLRQELFDELITMDNISSNVVKSTLYVSKKLNFGPLSKTTEGYWKKRGWSDSESSYKRKLHTKRGKISPFSKEFWMNKINPETNTNYTETEAIYEQNVRRPIRKEYWMTKGYNEDDATDIALKTKSQNNKKATKASIGRSKEMLRSSSKKCVEYWLLRGYSHEDAKEIISKSQATFSLEKCIEKYGDIDGRNRWLERQMKWHKSFKKSNFSKISQDLFWKVAEKLPTLDHIFFAQLSFEKTKDTTGKNNEYRLKLDSVILPDLIDLSKKKIVEFDGSYWHGLVGHGNKSRDKFKEEMLIKHGYQLLRISEMDYKMNPDGAVEKCINFLTQ